MLDSTEELSKEDKEILEKTKDKKHIVLINKIDIGNILKKEMFDDRITIEISTKTTNGIERLEDEIERMFNISDIQIENEIIVTNVRHKNLIVAAKLGIENAVKSIENGLPVDMLSIDLQEAMQNLGEITGEAISEEVVKGIFAKFCVGK